MINRTVCFRVLDFSQEELFPTILRYFAEFRDFNKFRISPAVDTTVPANPPITRSGLAPVYQSYIKAMIER